MLFFCYWCIIWKSDCFAWWWVTGSEFWQCPFDSIGAFESKPGMAQTLISVLLFLFVADGAAQKWLTSGNGLNFGTKTKNPYSLMVNRFCITGKLGNMIKNNGAMTGFLPTFYSMCSFSIRIPFGDIPPSGRVVVGRVCVWMGNPAHTQSNLIRSHQPPCDVVGLLHKRRSSKCRVYEVRREGWCVKKNIHPKKIWVPPQFLNFNLRQNAEKLNYLIKELPRPKKVPHPKQKKTRVFVLH